MIPVMLRAAWEAAEAQLYQTVATRPDDYQRAVVLVGRLSTVLLEQCADTRVLLARAADEQAAGWPTVVLVADQARVPVGSVDPGVLWQAACAMAGRRLSVVEADARRRDRMATAREAGERWVVLEESGDPAGVAWAPYRRLEVRAVDGVGVLAATEPLEDLVHVVHRVLAVQVDPGSGSIRGYGGPAAPGGPGRPEPGGDDALPDGYPDDTTRERAVSHLKATLEAGV